MYPLVEPKDADCVEVLVEWLVKFNDESLKLNMTVFLVTFVIKRNLSRGMILGITIVLVDGVNV